MSKMLRFTGSLLDECRGDFEKALAEAKNTDGKFSFIKMYPQDDRKATVYFTAEAWAKMVILIKDFDKEVAWHGIANRSEKEEEDAYYITDIVVYPQEVSGTTVEMDTKKYAMWLMENAEDERFDNIHMQGHSHVNMGVAPSGVDLTHQEEIVKMLGDEDFYIFMIWNKSFANNCKIYDMKKNALFENGDVTVMLADQNESLNDFLADAKEKVRNKYVYTAPTYQGGTRDDDKPPFSGVAAKPFNPVSRANDKPRIKPNDNKVSGQLILPGADNTDEQAKIFEN